MTAWLVALVLAAPAPGRVNINTADAAQLITLPGVGKAIAGRILESRAADGPFRSINELTRVRGIGAKTLEKLRPHIAVGGETAAAPAAGAGPAKPQGAPDKPRPPPPASAPAATKAFVGAVNVNTATADELKALPGIGPKTAAAVVMDRNDRGPFRTVDELTRVKGIGQGKLAKIRPFVTVGPPPKAP